MAEPTDAVSPILRRIQHEVAETRREVSATRRQRAEHGETLETIEGYLTYELTTRARADIQAIQVEMKDLKRRLSALERTRGGGKKR